MMNLLNYWNSKTNYMFVFDEFKTKYKKAVLMNLKRNIKNYAKSSRWLFYFALDYLLREINFCF